MNEGAPTYEEIDLGLGYILPGVVPGELGSELPSEEDVIKVAGRWSLNPLEFEGATEEVGPGWVGVV